MPDLVEMIGTGHLGAATDIIMEATDPATAKRLVDALWFEGVRTLDAWRDPLTDFVFDLLGVETSNANPRKPSTAASPADVNTGIEKHLERLFEIGTGWLGWSASDTWAATPTEILIAQRGLVAKLKAVNGVVDKPEHDPREEVTLEEAKAGIAKLRGLSPSKKRKAA